MVTMKIVAPEDSEKVYAIAAREFQKLYREVTGQTIPIVREPGETGDLVAVSYTHLDVYKRQCHCCAGRWAAQNGDQLSDV